MEEIEPPTEQVQEDIHHHAHEAPQKWVSWVALSTALIAALAAVSAMLASHHANDAMLEQLEASDKWAYYQAKGIEARLLEVERNLLDAQAKALPAEHAGKLDEYKHKRTESSEDAERLGASSRAHMARHVVYARGVTLFQIAIAIGAIAVLTRLKPFWYVSLAFAAIGLFFLVQGATVADAVAKPHAGAGAGAAAAATHAPG